MKRRDFMVLSAGTAAAANLMNACSLVPGLGNSRDLVDTPEKRAAYLQKMLKTLCADLGPHPVFDPAKHDEAARIIKCEMEKALPAAEYSECVFKGWKLLKQAEFSLGDRRLEAYACHGAPGTGDGGVSGVIRRVELKNPDKVFYSVVDPKTNEALAYILTNDNGPAIPLPCYFNPLEGPLAAGHATFDKQGKWPTVCLAATDIPLLEEAVKAKTAARYLARADFVPGMRAKSVVGVLPGETQEEILILAHLDTPYGSPGANDNTASMLVMVMIAHALSGTRPRRSVTFMATAGEEYGKLGAQHYLETREKAGTLKNIKVCVEFDSLTWGNNFQLYSTDKGLLQAVEKANADVKINGTPKLFNEYTGGDSRPFYLAGIPTLYVNSRGEKYMDTLKLWHRPEDTPGTVHPELVENAFLVFSEAVKRLAAGQKTV